MPHPVPSEIMWMLELLCPTAIYLICRKVSNDISAQVALVAAIFFGLLAYFGLHTTGDQTVAIVMSSGACGTMHGLVKTTGPLVKSIVSSDENPKPPAPPLSP